MDGFGPPIEDARTPDGAMDALFRRYRTWLTAKLGYRYGRENAEDLVQETFLRMTRASAATTARHPRALLMQIARNVAIDRFRRSQRELEASTFVADVEVFSELPSQQQALLIKQIVLALPPKLRDVFVLSQLEGLTHQEIARLKGISVKTVEWRMRKAFACCAAAMQD